MDRRQILNEMDEMENDVIRICDDLNGCINELLSYNEEGISDDDLEKMVFEIDKLHQNIINIYHLRLEYENKTNI